ncbi:peptidoglycan DD-metalloendopeptidase family protein [Deminuibacter soli]|uniref:Peptidase M23 n=1 Tax=Deminuibacter soli TaxID=2291815 RepID=A0A3E1NPE0_9BACT|nr:peptidoglycan DD-metalloendopeptidase family protein [Deminuibacter soli]RFM29792.1 peptidase M23 [Deminuibacter soli]
MENNNAGFEALLQQLQPFAQVVAFNPAQDKLLHLDFTAANKALNAALLADAAAFSRYVQQQIDTAGARYGIGGYNEHRAIYAQKNLFDNNSEETARCIHLATDIWAPAGTPVYAPFDGTVHSFAFNEPAGDYGATIILQHAVSGMVFHTLYGHMSLRDLTSLKEGMPVARGSLLAHFGDLHENGQWPPHLHFQLIRDMEGRKGDYPGVCAIPHRSQYLANCPDPDKVLNMMQYAKVHGMAHKA